MSTFHLRSQNECFGTILLYENINDIFSEAKQLSYPKFLSYFIYISCDIKLKSQYLHVKTLKSALSSTRNISLKVKELVNIFRDK